MISRKKKILFFKLSNLARGGKNIDLSLYFRILLLADYIQVRYRFKFRNKKKVSVG